jgi:hypothetical protein
LVRNYRELLTLLSAEIAGTTKVVVAIDELDKVALGRAAAFVDDIKAIFAADNPGCYVLVTVSDEAQANFDQRGVVPRNAIDSAFDELLHVDPMVLDTSFALLKQRLIGVPRPFAALCHVLSGGVPRDTIRLLRRLVALARTSGESELAHLATRLADEELHLRLRGLRLQLRAQSRESTDVARIARWADTLAVESVSSVHWPRLPDSVDHRGEAQAQVDQHVVSWAQLRTLVQFCGAARIDDWAAAWGQTGGGSLTVLATVREQAVIDPQGAIAALTKFRLHWELTP